MEPAPPAASNDAAVTSHYRMRPFSAVPPAVTDAIFHRLSRLNLAECSLVCKAWRYLPCMYMYSLTVGDFAASPPPADLHHCCHLQALHVSSSATSRWPAMAAELAQQQLPSLRSLCIQHSSSTSAEQLQQLQHIMQVQGPQCSLKLALTDKQSLHVLLGLLPLRGLVQLDLNVPYLPEGAAALLAEAAALQATAASSYQQQQQQQLYSDTAVQGTFACELPTGEECSSSNISSRFASTAGGTKQQFCVGVWVCCWGGCTGINLADAVSIQQQLQAVGCSLHGIESINCHSSDEVAGNGAALGQLPGLKALGFNYKRSSSNKQDSQRQDDTHIVLTAELQAENSSSRDWPEHGSGSSTPAAGWLQDHNTAALAALVPLHTSLQQLTLLGCPVGGFMQVSSQSGCNKTEEASPPPASRSSVSNSRSDAANTTAASQLSPLQHPLAALLGLTKLQLLKQWHNTPLPLSPVAQLTGLVELAVERSRLQHSAELACLGSLTRLTLLSLVLAVTADELVAEVQQGQWQLVETSAAAAAAAAAKAQQDVQVSELEQLLGGLQVQQPVAEQVAAAAGAETAGVGEQGLDGCCCCCCCSVAATAASTGAANSLPADAACQSTPLSSAGELRQQIMHCPCSAVVSASLLDWRWLRQLQQLQVAWLQVPHLDLTCLPANLTEIDVQQPHDLTSVSITCSSSSSSSSSSSRGVWLPNLKRMVLPRPLHVGRAEAAAHCTLANDRELGLQTADGTAHAAQQPDDAPTAEDSEGGSDRSDYDRAGDFLQLHLNAALLLELAANCPELQELELVQWQLPPAAVLAAAQQLRYLKLLSLLQPESKAEEELLRQQLAGVRGGSVALCLQERLVLSRYPWSSVLAMR